MTRLTFLIFLITSSFLSLGQSKSSELTSKRFMIENISPEKSCQLHNELISSRQDELIKKGWTQERLKEHACNKDHNSMDYLKRLVTKLKKKGLDARLTNENDLSQKMTEREYLIKVGYQMDITKNGWFKIFPVFSLYDSSDQLLFTEDWDRLIKRLVNF